MYIIIYSAFILAELSSTLTAFILPEHYFSFNYVISTGLDCNMFLSNIFLLKLFLVYATTTVVEAYIPNYFKPVLVDNNKFPEAVCLDGTPAAYYIRKATSEVNKTKWVLHLEGGGWCFDEATCVGRSGSHLGSSVNDTTPQDLNVVPVCRGDIDCGILMVNNETYNPMTYDWNAVLFRYCDGGSFATSADQPTVTNGSTPTTLYFRGWDNLKAILSTLIATEGLDQATEVLAGGASAGGLAAFLHIDYIADTIKTSSPDARVLGMPDSGYWPDSAQYAYIFRDFFAQGNRTVEGLNTNCVAKYGATDIEKCLYPQNFADLIETPLFVQQSLFDPLQNGTGPGDTSRDGHSRWLLDTINNTILTNRKNGAWVYSCERHCGGQLLVIDDMQVPEALPVFQQSQQNQRLWLQNHSYPCTDCCNGQFGPQPDNVELEYHNIGYGLPV